MSAPPPPPPPDDEDDSDFVQNNTMAQRYDDGGEAPDAPPEPVDEQQDDEQPPPPPTPPDELDEAEDLNTTNLPYSNDSSETLDSFPTTQPNKDYASVSQALNAASSPFATIQFDRQHTGQVSYVITE